MVGDTIRVVFRNNGDRPYSVHPHGVFYEKSSEGVPYNDGTSRRRTRLTTPCRRAATYTYVWPVPARAGPGPMDGSSVMWMYHSHVDEVRDINTGLIGPIIITARGKARPDGSPKDVDREIVASFVQVTRSRTAGSRTENFLPLARLRAWASVQSRIPHCVRKAIPGS